MSQEQRIISAIDIGTTKIVALIGRIGDNGKIHILGKGDAFSVGVKRGVVLNIEKTVESIRTAVDEAEEKAGLKIQDVYVGIAGQHIRSIRNRGYINIDPKQDEIKMADVNELIADAHRIPTDVGEEIIHVLPQTFIVDNETDIKNPVGMFGRRLEANFHIVISQSTAANNTKKCITRAGMNVGKIFLEPLASAQAVLTEDEMEAGVAMIDIGGGTSDLAVYYDGIIRHTAVIPFGGNIINNDIKKGCNILDRQAEALKIQFGSAIADRDMDNKIITIPGISGRPPKEISCKFLAHIIQSRMEEIIAHVVYEIEACGFHDKLGAGIVITGGGAMLKNLPQLVSFKTGYDVRIGYPVEYLTSDLRDNINHPMYATGIGLLLKGNQESGAGKNCTVPMEEKPEPSQDVAPVVSQEREKNVKKVAKEPKRNKFNDFLEKFSEFFEVDDQKM